MSTPFELLTARRDAALAALDAGDYAAALSNAVAAQAILAAIPDSEHGGRGASAMQWGRDAIDQFIRNVRQLQKEAGLDEAGRAVAGIRRTHITYTRPGDTGDYS
ncbi:MAG TPA: hypothetical protein VMW52_05950 [Phycisphaerae bacterium]|nr:hypothetical protein [Phycisphaerae bacterium]